MLRDEPKTKLMLPWTSQRRTPALTPPSAVAGEEPPIAAASTAAAATAIIIFVFIKIPPLSREKSHPDDFRQRHGIDHELLTCHTPIGFPGRGPTCTCR